MLIAQLSDAHISTSREIKILALQNAVAHLLNLPMRPDMVLMTGDCTDNGTLEEYALFKSLLEPLPVYVIPGNHDSREVMLREIGFQGEQGLDGFMQYVLNSGPVRLIALDTHVPGWGGGELDAVRLHWLAGRLAEAPHTPTIIFMHHPPLVAGLSVMDSIGLEGTKALHEIVVRHPQIERILAGHTHMAQAQRFAGTLLMTCSGLDSSFMPDWNQPKKLVVQKQPPLCLLHHWTAATGLMTYTSVIGQYVPETLHDGNQWLA